MSLKSICKISLALMLVSSAYAYEKIAPKVNAENVIKTFDLSSNKNLKMLDVQDYQQTTDITCGPSAVMSLLHYYGTLKDSDMNSKTELRIAKEMGTNDDYGTTVKQIVNWLKKQGYEVNYGTKGTIGLIDKNIQKGMPVLVDWIDWGGHWTLVSGYQKLGKTVDDDKDTMFMTDPAVHFNNTKTIYGLTAILIDFNLCGKILMV